MRRLTQTDALEPVITELKEAKRILASGTPSTRVVLGVTSEGTLNGQSGHFDVDVASYGADGQMETAVQVLRAQTSNVRNAVRNAFAKAESQLRAAPAKQLRMVTYLQPTTMEELEAQSAWIQAKAQEYGVTFEFILPEGTRMTYSPN